MNKLKWFITNWMITIVKPKPMKYAIAISHEYKSKKKVIYRTRNKFKYKVARIFCRVLYFDVMYVWCNGGTEDA